MVDLKLEFGGSLCYTPLFVINGKDADYNDFGDKYDRDPENAEDYGCGNMQFKRDYERKDELMQKYNINHEEWDMICNKLEEGLSFGTCGWCI